MNPLLRLELFRQTHLQSSEPITTCYSQTRLQCDPLPSNDTDPGRWLLQGLHTKQRQARVSLGTCATQATRVIVTPVREPVEQNHAAGANTLMAPAVENLVGEKNTKQI